MHALHVLQVVISVYDFTLCCIRVWDVLLYPLVCSHFAKLATSIAVRDVSSPESFDLKNYFPDFLWLLRDAILTVPPGRDGKPMTPTDYLKTKVLKRGTSFEESTVDKIGRSILTLFPTVECMTITPPSTDPSVMQEIVSHQDLLEPRFNEQIECLVKYLLQHVQAKNGFVKGKLVDGPLLATMATQFLEVVNDPDAIPCIADTWQAAVEMRCKKVLDQMAREYTSEMQGKIAEVGLPMEEDSDTKPNTLFGLHRLTLLQKTECLLKQVGHFVGAAVLGAEGEVATFSRDSLIAELEQRTAVFAEEDASVQVQGKTIRKKVVIGGELLVFAQRNHKESRSQCLALFGELYMQIESKMQGEGKSYTFVQLLNDLTALQEDYFQRAVGPAKWEVYTEKEVFIKSQEKSYKSLLGFKKESFNALQKAAEEKAKNDRLGDLMNKIQIQMKNDAELKQQRMQAVQEHHQDEINSLHQEMSKRMEEDRQKYDDLMKAQLQEMAEITKENSEASKEQYDMMFKAMKETSDQNQAGLTVMNKTISTMKAAIENMPGK